MSEQSIWSRRVEREDEGVRLDRWLRREIPDLTQGIIQKNLRLRGISVNGRKAEASLRLQVGDEVTVRPQILKALEGLVTQKPLPRLSSPALQKLANEIQNFVEFRGDGFLVLNKPHGVATQGGTGIQASLDEALNLWLAPQGLKAFLVHRLDKDTSGLLIVALTQAMATELSRLFRERLVRKTYLAVVVGAPPELAGQCHTWMMKQRGVLKEKMGAVSKETPGALEAHCSYRVLGQGEGLSLVELIPETGRTHQLRLQMALLGCPILGDFKYGGQKALPQGREGLHLHARSLQLNLSRGDVPFAFEALLPEMIEETLRNRGIIFGVVR